MKNPFTPVISNNWIKNADIISNYYQIFNCDLTVANKMAKMTGGYMYAYQLLGFLVFNHTNKKVLTLDDLKQIELEYKLKLFDNVYEKIFNDLSEWDRKYLIAINGGKRMQDVIQQLGKDKVFVAQYRRRAIERHLIKPAGYGIVRYILPYFDEYINQVQDPDSAYYFGY